MKGPPSRGFLAMPWPCKGGSGNSYEGSGALNSGKEGWEGLILKCAAVLGVAIISYYAVRRWVKGGKCRATVRLDGKTAVITGANTGIGKETSKDFARRGARVVMACRDLTRAEQAAEEIRQSTGNGNVVTRHLDLSSLYSVRQFAKDYIDTEDRLDILVNNAGVMMCPKGKTEDGFETQLAVNHLGHFLLTNLLLPKLKSSAPSRVITVSSIAHKGGRIDFDDLFFEKRLYSPMESYKQSKLANVLFTRELAKRLKGTGVSAFCLHPGVIFTDLGRHLQDSFPILGKVLVPPSLVLMKTPKEGCQTTLHCALTPGLESLSGRYFSDCAEKKIAPEGLDEEVAKRLWEESARLVGLEETC